MYKYNKQTQGFSMTKIYVQSKWQKASAKITNLRWEIENVISDFTEEEKQSKKYQNLLETLDLLMDHMLHDYNQNKVKKLEKEIDRLMKELKALRKSSSLFSWRTMVIAVSGGLLTEVAKYLIKIVAILIGEAP